MAAATVADLLPFMDGVTCETFNFDDAHPLRNAITEECRDNSELTLRSDVDEELLVILRFRQLVKVSAISVKGPADKGPSSVKVCARMRRSRPRRAEMPWPAAAPARKACDALN